MSSSDSLVTLANGPAVPLAAVRLVWNLEDRGCHLEVAGDVLRIGPRERLTDADRSAIRDFKPAIVQLVGYVEAIRTDRALSPDAGPIRSERIKGEQTMTWPEPWRELFEERAAIMEFDGRLTRAEANKRAAAIVWTEMDKAASRNGGV